MVDSKTPDLHTENLLRWQICSTLSTNTTGLKGSSEGQIWSDVCCGVLAKEAPFLFRGPRKLNPRGGFLWRPWHIKEYLLTMNLWRLSQLAGKSGSKSVIEAEGSMDHSTDVRLLSVQHLWRWGERIPAKGSSEFFLYTVPLSAGIASGANVHWSQSFHCAFLIFFPEVLGKT